MYRFRYVDFFLTPVNSTNDPCDRDRAQLFGKQEFYPFVVEVVFFSVSVLDQKIPAIFHITAGNDHNHSVSNDKRESPI